MNSRIRDIPIRCSREVDLTKKATIFTLGDCILHAAGEDADQIGFGVRELQRKNMTWVLSRMAVEVYRFPEEYERYTIGTWVGEISRLMTTRNFVVHDADDRRIAAASTCWAMIDMQSRLPLDLREKRGLQPGADFRTVSRRQTAENRAGGWTIGRRPPGAVQRRRLQSTYQYDEVYPVDDRYVAAGAF